MPATATGDGDEVEALGLKATVAAHLSEIDAREINSIPLGDGSDGEPIVARVGRYGPYLQRGEDRASIPDDMAPDELTIERAEEILAAPSNDRVLGTDPESGLDDPGQGRAASGPTSRWARSTEGGDKPRTASLFSSMDPATLTLEQALELLRIPRTVGTDPETGEEVVAHNGQVRSVSQARVRHAQPDERGPAADGDAGRGAGAVRPAQAAPGPGGRGTAARARHRPGHQPAGGGEGGTLRPLRDRRHHQRQPAQGRRRSSRSTWTGPPSCWPSAGPPGPSTRKKKAAKKAAPAKKAAKKATKKAAAKKTATAKKATAKKAGGEEDGRGDQRPRRPIPPR